MDIIKLFPARKSPPRSMDNGPVYFTCPTCKNEMEMRFERMRFRSVELICQKCQGEFKVSNPSVLCSQLPQKPK